MGEVVNLRLARRRRARAAREAEADANRARHGRSGAERRAQALAEDGERRRLDGHRLSGDAPVEANGGADAGSDADASRPRGSPGDAPD